MTAFELSFQAVIDTVAGWFDKRDADEEAKQQEKKAQRGAAAQPSTEPGKSVLTDEQVVARIRRSSKGAEFAALYDLGDTAAYERNASAADFGLIGKLRWWCRDDAAQIERIMRDSKLSRAKWDEPRPGGTYLSESIKNCISKSDGSVFEPPVVARFKVFSPDQAEFKGEQASDREPEQPDVETQHPPEQAEYKGGQPAGEPSGEEPQPPDGSEDFDPTEDPGEDVPDDNTRQEVNGDSVDNPHRLASAVLNSLPAGTLRFWRGQLWQWADGAFRARTDDEMRAVVTRACREQFLLAYDVELADWDATPPKERDKRPMVRKVTIPLVNNVLNVVRSLVCLSNDIRPPCWIDGADGPDSREVIAVKNGLLDASTLTLHSHSPCFFTLNALPFSYDHEARADEWEKFLLSVWHDEATGTLDAQSINTVEEWLGYCLTQDLRHDKVMFLLGPPRSGKSIIREALRQLVGENNYAAINLDQLGAQFGLQHLPDKLVAADGDARLSGKTDAVAIVKRLLTITGKDPVNIDRKNLVSINERLTARFLICSNELPKLPDASGVVADRFLIVRFFRSFVGKEDKGLEERLMRELPGILNRALEGRQRLSERGYFVQPDSAADAREILANLTSPVATFVREECTLDINAFVPTADLFRSWASWCERQNRQHVGTAEDFAKNLMAAAPCLIHTRKRQRGDGKTNRIYGYIGIRFRTFEDDDKDDGED